MQKLSCDGDAGVNGLSLSAVVSDCGRGNASWKTAGGDSYRTCTHKKRVRPLSLSIVTSARRIDLFQLLAVNYHVPVSFNSTQDLNKDAKL